MIFIFRRPIIWIMLALIGAGAYFFLRDNSLAEKSTKAQVASAVRKEIPSIDALLVQEDSPSNIRRIIKCSAAGCIPQKAPQSVTGEARSDGTNWYRYVDTGSEKTPHAILEKIDASGNTQTITEQNPLVRPRDMILSVDGGKLAYFLDNISDDKNLTELWVYDSVQGGTRVVAEKLSRKDIASSVRWSTSSQVAWFLQDGKEKQLVVVRMNGASSLAGFAGVNWNDHAAAADSGVMDVNDDATLVAFAEVSHSAFSKIYVAQESGPTIQKSVKGNVVFLRWMEGGALLYAVQDGKDVSFWMANSEKEWPVTRMAAAFESAHSVGSATEPMVAFIASPRSGEKHLYVLQVASGNIKDEAVIPQFSGKTHLVQASKSNDAGAVAGSTSALTDTVLVAFIEQHIKDISKEKRPKATRILMTDASNTCLVDYINDAGQEQRIQVAIVDVNHPEWRIEARYRVVNGIWTVMQGGTKYTPKAVRLYEWEDALSQWILKNTF